MAKAIKYQVKYRPHRSFFWRKIKNVLEDGVIDDTNVRFFINDKQERIELALEGIHLVFSAERADAIEELNRKTREDLKIQSNTGLAGL
jgi:hypothetical protein